MVQGISTLHGLQSLELSFDFDDDNKALCLEGVRRLTENQTLAKGIKFLRLEMYQDEDDIPIYGLRIFRLLSAFVNVEYLSIRKDWLIEPEGMHDMLLSMKKVQCLQLQEDAQNDITTAIHQFESLEYLQWYGSFQYDACQNLKTTNFEKLEQLDLQFRHIVPLWAILETAVNLRKVRIYTREFSLTCPEWELDLEELADVMESLFANSRSLEYFDLNSKMRVNESINDRVNGVMLEAVCRLIKENTLTQDFL